jgi:hypothetical protein
MTETPNDSQPGVIARVHPRATLAATVLTLPLLFFVFAALFSPDLYEDLSRQDNLESTGIIEHLTVIVLIPGILAALFALVRFRDRFPSRLHAGWLLMWTLACIYFAGEECSWGQWYFGFETPDFIEEINTQDEFNLHNTSSWLNQKPRAAVEAFVVIAGLTVPVLAVRGRLRALAGLSWPAWVLAPAMCWAAAAYFVLVRMLDWIDRFGIPTVDAELRELSVAWFLALYLISYPLRLARSAGTTPTRS